MSPIQKSQLMNELLIYLMVKAIRNNEMLNGFFDTGIESYDEALQEQRDDIGKFFAKIMETSE